MVSIGPDYDETDAFSLHKSSRC